MSGSQTALSKDFLAIFKQTGPQLDDKAKKSVGRQVDTLMKELAVDDKKVGEGVKTFRGFLHVDDIVLSGGIKTGEKVKLLQGISDTVEIINAGRAKFVKPAAKLDKLQAQLKVDPKTDIYPQCLKTVNGWEEDVPSGILDERTILKDRIKALTADKPTKDQMKLDAEKDIADLQNDADNFKKIVGSHSTRSFARTNPFGTKMLSSLTGDERKALDLMWEKLAKAGQVFLDATISIDKLGDDGQTGKQEDTRYDFEALYKNITDIGLPEAWWPPRLVERVQAWRKARRVHTEKKTEAPDPAWKQIGGEMLGAFSQLLKLGKLGGSIAAFDNSFKEESEEAQKTAERIFSMIGSICEITDNLRGKSLSVVKGEAKEQIAEMLNFDETIDLEERLDQLLTIVQNPLDFCKQAIDLTAQIGKLDGTHWAKTMDTKVVPGLSLAIAILNLATAIKEAAKSARLTGQTERLRVTSEQQDSSGLRQDGGATSGSLKKMVGTQKEYTGRQGLKAAVETLNVTGQAVILSGVSAPAGYALTMTATGIELAGEMVFDGIDWGQARVAKKLLQDARAGSPTAQQLIFEKCVLYATLYLAILVREGDPLGKKYIEDRGITQDALDKPMAIWLLGETMREAVEKEDDTEIDDNLLMHLGGPIAKLGKRIGNAVVDGGSALVEKGRQALASDYDENWTPNSASLTALTITFDPQGWDDIKQDAIDNAGLANVSTGVTAGIKALNKAWEAFKDVPDTAKEEAKLRAISAVLQQIGAVWGMLSGYQPMQGKAPTKPHVPFQAVRDALINVLNGLAEKFKEETRGMTSVSLQDQGGRKVLDIPATAWKPIAAEAACAAQWTKTWQGAANTIGLGKDDYGVGKVLHDLDEAWTAWQQLEGASQIVNAKSGEALYKARSTALAILQKATTALGDAARMVAVFPNLAAFAAAGRDDLARQMRSLDEKLCSGRTGLSIDSKPVLPVDKAATGAAMAKWAEMWGSSWSQAAELGLCSRDGGKGFATELAGFGETYATYRTRDDKDKKAPSKRDEAIHAAARVLKGCDALIQKEPYAPDVILALAKAYLTDAMAGRTLLINEVTDTVVVDGTALKDLAAAVPGAIPPGGKGLIEPNSLHKTWTAAYQACLDKGVAEKSDSGGKLGEVLLKVETAMATANTLLKTGKCTADTIDDLYDAMDDVRKQIVKAIELLNKLTAAPGFAANDQVLDLIDVVGAEFSNYLVVIEDRRGKIEIEGGTLDPKQFSKVKTNYVKQGLAPKDKTGLSDLMQTAAKASKNDKAGALKKLRDQLDVAIKLADDAMTLSKSPPPVKKGKQEKRVELDYTAWITYLQQLKALAV